MVGEGGGLSFFLLVKRVSSPKILSDVGGSEKILPL